jgi:hypothetical protein
VSTAHDSPERRGERGRRFGRRLPSELEEAGGRAGGRPPFDDRGPRARASSSSSSSSSRDHWLDDDAEKSARRIADGAWWPKPRFVPERQVCARRQSHSRDEWVAGHQRTKDLTKK